MDTTQNPIQVIPNPDIASTSTPDSPVPLTFVELAGAMGRLTGLMEQQITQSMVQQENGTKKPNTLDSFQRKDPPTFSGTPDPDVAEEWRRKMEKIFKAMECTDAQKLRFATFKLTGEADHWWNTMERQLTQERTEVTWQDFLDAFDRQYFPDTVKQKKEAEFDRLVQGKSSVAIYESKFNALSRYAPHITADDKRKARKFEQGLRKNIRDKLAAFQFQSYQEAVGHALNVESKETDFDTDREGEPQHKRPRFEDKRNQENQKDRRAQPWEREDKEELQEFQGQQDFQTRQGDQGHQKFYEPQSQKPQCPKCSKFHFGQCRWNLSVCYNCGGKGHMSRECRKPRGFNPGNSTNAGSNDQRKKVPGRVFAMGMKDTEN